MKIFNTITNNNTNIFYPYSRTNKNNSLFDIINSVFTYELTFLNNSTS